MIIKYTTLRIVIGLVLIAVLAFSPQDENVLATNNLYPQIAQLKTSTVIRLETYKRVLDLLFSRDEPTSRGSLWTLVLRFMPSSRPESQIIIRRDVDRNLGVEVIRYTSPDGSIYNQLNLALAKGVKDDPAEMAKSIKVIRKKVNISDAKAGQWHASFFESLTGTTKTLSQMLLEAEKTGVESLVMHGTFYELWYEQGLKEMSFNLYDSEIDKLGFNGEFKLVQWMNSLRREVEKM